jgi:predicted MPP superfamily phosphohydrolase
MALSNSTLTRRQLLSVGGLALAGLATTSKAAVFNDTIEITRHEVVLPYLDPVFDGMTVTLASDIHSSPYMSLQDMKAIVRTINSLQNDLIVLPGDFVTENLEELPPFLEAFSELRAPAGILATLGNHDFDANADAVTRGLEEIGIRTLRNENTALTRNGKHLHFLGVDEADDDQIVDHIKGKASEHIEALFKGVPDDAASILLCHKPYRFKEYSKAGVGLMLSGHTHGGQIVLARFGGTPITVCSLATKYVDGWFTSEENAKMYVSRGLGVVDIPMRINCPPEIAQLTLRSQQYADRAAAGISAR